MKGQSHVHLAPKARELRAEGLIYRDIAARLGVGLSTVAEWCRDPERRTARARRARYAGTCERCGGPTDGSGGYTYQPLICSECLGWSEEEIIAAMRRWADEHGAPPLLSDWRAAGDGHPCATVVVRNLGWNETLLRAGFGLRADRRTETWAQVEAMLREGLSVRDIAAHFGWTTANVYNRLRHRGLRVADFR